MTTAMPRPRPLHLHREISRHGKTVWYVRVGRGRRFRLKTEFGTPEFETEYLAALAGHPTPTKGRSAGTLGWLFDRYRETPAWRNLSLETRKQREQIMAPVLKNAGHQPFAKINRSSVVAARDRRGETPAQARHYLEAMRGLFKWAVDAGMAKDNPTIGVDDPARAKTGGIPVWTEEQVEAYERRWPVGTRQRVWLDVLLYTGLRRGDAVKLGRQHVRNGVASFKTEKSKSTIEVTLPILPVLAETLKAGPCGELSFIVGANGGCCRDRRAL